MAHRVRLKGLARALRADGFRERPRVALGRHAEEALFKVADVLTEGGVRDGVWFGCIMIAFDLDRLQDSWRGALDGAAREALSSAVAGSVRVRIRATRLARAEVARRFPGQPLGTAQVETKVRLSEKRLLMDIDLEVPIGVCSKRKRV